MNYLGQLTSRLGRNFLHTGQKINMNSLVAITKIMFMNSTKNTAFDPSTISNKLSVHDPSVA